MRTVVGKDERCDVVALQSRMVLLQDEVPT